MRPCGAARREAATTTQHRTPPLPGMGFRAFITHGETDANSTIHLYGKGASPLLDPQH